MPTTSRSRALPLHAVLAQAAGGEPLRVGGVSSLLSRLRVILKLLDDVPHAAGTDCRHRHCGSGQRPVERGAMKKASHFSFSVLRPGNTLESLSLIPE
ncbi:hypothetical protein EYF80_053252 [Liparis tanakae]|uniref:Uncharacterized protein n=1 Tax=Liparis tanakae TaxID=230148 RepID=A0A4Z2F676_9TELE|nr:hypothetical protein EYF80_053252 [Liparis tanakae]